MRKPCFRRGGCSFFSREIGYRCSFQKTEKLFYICTLGIFSMTHKKHRLPDRCNGRVRYEGILRRLKEDESRDICSRQSMLESVNIKEGAEAVTT